MRIGTIISLGASAVLGIGALFVAKVWLPQTQHADASAKGPVAQVQTVPVVVATSAIPYGAKLEASKLTVAQLPVGAAPQGAYATVAQVIGANGGAPIALIPIAAREPVLQSKLSGGGGKNTVAAMIAEGMRAYTIGVSDTAGGGGHVMPGDRVDVVLTRDLSASGSSESQAQGKRLVSNIVIQNVRILGMDLNADPSSTQAAIAHTATLEVTVEDAERLALSTQAGTLTLALRRTGGAEVAPVRTIVANDLGPIGPGPRPGGVMAVRHRTAVKPAFAVGRRSITVVHGDAKSSVDVPTERGSGV
jgi:pilus assembly protein CpaB